MRMLQAMMTDFIMLGALSATGSYAMHLDKTGMLRAALNGHSNQISEALNRQAVSKLMLLNGVPKQHWPKIVPSDSDAPNLAELSSFMGAMSQMGMKFFPDADIEAFVRKAARLPEMSEEERSVRTAAKRKSEVSMFMQVQAELLQAKQGIRELASQDDASAEISSDPESEDQMKLQQMQAAGMDPYALATGGELEAGDMEPTPVEEAGMQPPPPQGRGG